MKESCVCTDTDYIHYLCNAEYDYGWGCAYRSLQMLLGCLIKSGALSQLEAPPSIGELQSELARIGRLSHKDIYSHKWSVFI
jgi:hypothetical protein